MIRKNEVRVARFFLAGGAYWPRRGVQSAFGMRGERGRRRVRDGHVHPGNFFGITGFYVNNL